MGSHDLLHGFQVQLTTQADLNMQAQANLASSVLIALANTSFYKFPMYGKRFGTFSSSYEGFYKKWEPIQNFENSANFDENLPI